MASIGGATFNTG